MKKIMKTIAVIASLSLATSALACSIDGSRANGGFVPENNLKIPANRKGINTGITEAQFNAVIDKVEGIYAPIVSSDFGAKLNVERNWTDGTVNAYASQSGKNYKVAMFGGLARHATITEDGFALVICHEIGHHIGGSPKKGEIRQDQSPEPTPGGGWWGGSKPSTTVPAVASWASNEGQADYFANLKCLRRVFLNDDNAAIVKSLNAPASLVSACAKAYPGKSAKADADICVRAGMAGMSTAKLFQALRNSNVEPKFETPDSKVVSKTDDNHPAYQCRLDTYFQGSLCDVDMNSAVSQKDETVGTCHKLNGHSNGLRPLCWHNPRNSFTDI